MTPSPASWAACFSEMWPYCLPFTVLPPDALMAFAPYPLSFVMRFASHPGEDGVAKGRVFRWCQLQGLWREGYAQDDHGAAAREHVGRLASLRRQSKIIRDCDADHTGPGVGAKLLCKRTVKLGLQTHLSLLSGLTCHTVSPAAHLRLHHNPPARKAASIHPASRRSQAGRTAQTRPSHRP